MQGADSLVDATPLWLRVPPNIQPLLRSGDLLMQTLAGMHVDLAQFAAPPLHTPSPACCADADAGNVSPPADMHDVHALHASYPDLDQTHGVHSPSGSAGLGQNGLKKSSGAHISVLVEDSQNVPETPQVRLCMLLVNMLWPQARPPSHMSTALVLMGAAVMVLSTRLMLYRVRCPGLNTIRCRCMKAH